MQSNIRKYSCLLYLGYSNHGNLMRYGVKNMHTMLRFQKYSTFRTGKDLNEIIFSEMGKL
jgi:hypothetical protein